MSFGLVINLSSVLSGVQLLWMAIVNLDPENEESNNIKILHYYELGCVVVSTGLLCFMERKKNPELNSTDITNNCNTCSNSGIKALK